MAKKKKQLATTHVTFLIDRSGSMASQHQGVVTGFRDYVKEQQASEGDMTLLAIQFDSTNPHEIVVNGKINSIAPEALADMYQPRAATPLYDATARAITATAAVVEETNPDHVIVVVFTDGAENASTEYSLPSLTRLVEQKEAAGWTFVYLGEQGTHNVYAQAASYGTSSVNTSGYANADAAFASVSTSTSSLRQMKNDSVTSTGAVLEFFTDDEGNSSKTAETPDA